ncbi:MAG: endonuclease III domain-containing protein [Planctomycetes bacterium]|jgi:endonuclease-3 related protein|nr:endonuclease III domain-containing protein [Planctomycetota bacterium]
MKTTRELLLEIYQRLFDFFGPQHWWPGESPFEVAVGAILTQNTSWTNVAKAIANLKAAGSLDAFKLHEMDLEQLELLIRPAGYFRVKAKRLKNFIRWLCERYDGDLVNLEPVSTNRLREELLAISGIGPETADSILLYALNRPVFVVDTYTARVMVRHGLIGPELDYQQLQGLFMSNLEPDAAFFNEFHALLVMTGKDYCKPRPKCAPCPLDTLGHRTEIELNEA